MPRVTGFMMAPGDLDEDDGRLKPRLPEAQKDMLLARFAAYKQSEPPVVGALYTQRKGFEYVKGDILFVMWKVLNFNDPFDKLLIEKWISKHHVAYFDCMVGFLDNDGDTLFMVADSQTFERYVA